MRRYDVRAAQFAMDNAAEDDDERAAAAAARRADTAAHASHEPYADIEREWGGVECRRLPFYPSNWQEGDSF